MERTGRPGYQVVADDLRAQIAAGELPPGRMLPSISVLKVRYGASESVVKHALTVLKAEGVVIGQQGKGVFVADAPVGGPIPLDVQATLRVLLARVEELERRVEELSGPHRPPAGSTA